MKRYYILVLLTAFLILTFTGRPIQSQIVFGKFKVYVNITCRDDNTKNSIESYIKRELRSLQDVQILVKEQDANHQLSIVAHESTYTQSGQKTGDISVAYMYLQKFRLSSYKYSLTNAGWERMKNLENRLYFTPNLGVQNGMTTDIDKVCKSIVVTFDTEELEPIRKHSSEFLK